MQGTIAQLTAKGVEVTTAFSISEDMAFRVCVCGEDGAVLCDIPDMQKNAQYGNLEANATKIVSAVSKALGLA